NGAGLDRGGGSVALGGESLEDGSSKAEGNEIGQQLCFLAGRHGPASREARHRRAHPDGLRVGNDTRESVALGRGCVRQGNILQAAGSYTRPWSSGPADGALCT